MYQDRKGKYHKKPNNIEPQKRESANGVYLRDGKILLVKPSWVNSWEFPGGGKENNESIIEALKREFIEETGLKIIKFNKKPFYKVKTKFYADDLDIFFDSTIYFFKINEVKKQIGYVVDKKEIIKINYFSLETLNNKNTKSVHLEAIKQMDF